MLTVSCSRPNISEVRNLAVWVANRIILIQVKEEEYFHWLVQEELVCIHYVVLCGTALFSESYWNRFLCILSW